MSYDKEFWKNHNPDSIAFEQNETKITYGDLVRSIDEKLMYFRNIGIKEYDQIIISINNPLLFICIYLALWKMNVTIIPIDSQMNKANFRKILQVSDANYFITNKADGYSYSDIEMGNYPNLKKILLFKESSITVVNLNIDAQRSSWLDDKRNVKNDGFFILFTSGTSGCSKGVVIKKHAFLRNSKKVVSYVGITEKDTLLINLPLSYSFALSQVFAHLIVGGRIILSTNNVYNMLTLYEIKEKNVTNYAATPYFYEVLAKEIKTDNKIDIGKLKFFMCAGGYINPFVIETIIKAFPTVSFYNNYGQTEASPRISYKRLDINSDDYSGVGNGIKGVKIQIYDDAGNVLESGKVGEIGYISEDLMLGYYKNKIVNPNEYFMSGDLGRIENNNLIVVGRKDSLMKINGRKVYKNYIENAIFRLPYVKNVRLKKVTHSIYGEYFIAYIVPKEGETEETVIENIHEFCKINFNTYERPKRIIVCDELPLSANKKVQMPT